MSTAVFPSLPGLAFPLPREAIWETLQHEATSGKETRVAKRAAPRWRWTLAFKVLRTQAAFLELQTLAGFFNARQGKFDSFLYADPYDNAAAAAALGTGDGATTAFQLLRGFGGFIETVLAPNVVSAVYLNGVAQSGASWSVSNWGAAAPGVVTFMSPPGAGVAVSADFSFYWPVRLDDDVAAFGNFMQNLYDLKKLSFISIK